MILFRKSFLTWLLIGPLIAVTGGCSTNADRVILLPNMDSSPSALILKTASSEQVIDKPYEAVSINQHGTITPLKENSESVAVRYAEVLAAQPKRPTSYTVYFDTGKDQITQDSQIVLNEMKADLKSRSAPEIVVIGHTDRVGKVEVNDVLSLERARVVRDILVAEGVPEKLIQVAGRGEREPLVQTADEVAEPRNRRVEISVR